MSDRDNPNTIRTRIWREEPESDNPFATRAAYCRGFDVYGDMLGRARWVDLLYLLFHEDAPTLEQANLLETLAVALANPGPRDTSVHAAMCGGIGGSTAASSLIAALAVGAGRLGGGREVYAAVVAWQENKTNIDAWRSYLGFAQNRDVVTDAWPEAEHPPGFDPHGVRRSTIVRQALAVLVAQSPMDHLAWLDKHLDEIEAAAGMPLSMAGVAAAALVDLGFDAEQAEMLYLLLRLPGAAAHALEQRGYGYKHFPFFQVELESDGTEGSA
jgi:citrate synthase